MHETKILTQEQAKEILDINKNANLEKDEIEKNYFELCKEMHWDWYLDNSESIFQNQKGDMSNVEKQMELIHEAYIILVLPNENENILNNKEFEKFKNLEKYEYQNYELTEKKLTENYNENLKKIKEGKTLPNKFNLSSKIKLDKNQKNQIKKECKKWGISDNISKEYIKYRRFPTEEWNILNSNESSNVLFEFEVFKWIIHSTLNKQIKILWFKKLEKNVILKPYLRFSISGSNSCETIFQNRCKKTYRTRTYSNASTISINSEYIQKEKNESDTEENYLETKCLDISSNTFVYNSENKSNNSKTITITIIVIVSIIVIITYIFYLISKQKK